LEAPTTSIIGAGYTNWKLQQQHLLLEQDIPIQIAKELAVIILSYLT
jgi:hypothetical protein